MGFSFRRGSEALRGAGALLLGLALTGSGEAPLLAQTRDELRSAARRLLQVEATLDPLPDSGLTRDVGDIAVVEHDGSSYDDRLPDGTLNYEARTRVGRRFYETHGDDYDFLVVFTNFEFQTGEAQAFHMFGRNDVEGIGKPVGSVGEVVFGSRARLKGWIDMAAVSRYRRPPYSLERSDRGFLETLGVLAHEVGHQWLAQAAYAVDGITYDDLLGKDESHWSYLLDSDGSFYYGADWRPLGDGRYVAARAYERYSDLDLYLMGLLAPDRLPPFTLLQNPAIDRHRINAEGEVVEAVGAREIRLEHLVSAMGPRTPGFQHSQKEFRLGFVFLTRPGTDPAPEDLEAVGEVRRAFGAHFFALTHGVAWADTSLAVAPSAPRAEAPDLDRALAWLTARQALDGSWSDVPETRVRDTATAVLALASAGAAGPAAPRGLAWLQQSGPESVDFRARLAAALATGTLTAPDRATRVAGLFSSQNPDGGFGAGPDFASDALDTALALRALRALGQPEDARIRRAVAALAGLANADGGWPAVVGGDTSTVVTAEVLLALLDWKETGEASALLTSGLAALLARQNPDGGFGSSPSSAHATALALQVLLGTGAPGPLADAATAWLEENQLVDGSWAASSYQTALVLGALRQSLGANLVVPADSVTVSPNPAREGEVARLAARVRNAGRAATPASVARLYDADPASSPSRGEAAVPELAPGAEAEVAFDYPTVDRPGARTLYVVADAAGQVRESREDDNTASRLLIVEGLLPDLVVRDAGIGVVPAGPEVGETVTIHVSVQNAGARVAPESLLLVVITDPSGRRIVPPLAGVPSLTAGEAAAVAVSWTPTAEGTHTIQAEADPGHRVPESDETNGVAARTVEVVAAAPGGPELAVAAASVGELTELPQAVDVVAVVENGGRQGATTTVGVFDRYRFGPRLGSVDVEVGARSSAIVRVPVEITTGGTRALFVVVDPDGLVAEPDEGNNARSTTLRDAGTNDLEVGAVSVAPPEGEVGQTLTVSTVVRNRGTLDAVLVPVQLLRAGTEELARTAVTVAAGESATVDIPWTPVVAADPLSLLVRVDPFDLLPETREENNTGALALRVRPASLPNVTVGGADLAVTPDPPVEGQPATVSAVVRNPGGVHTGPFSVRFFLGDPDFEGRLIGEAPIADLEAGGAVTASAEWSPVDVRGGGGLYVVADALHEVTESIETDNQAFHAFSAIGLPDLVLTIADVSFVPGYPRVGEPVAIRATVRNLGDRPSAATTLLVVEGESGATVLATLPVPDLAPAASTSASFAWTPGQPLGARVLHLTVDPEGAVVEHDEGNNEVRRTFVVQDPDVYLTAPFFSPDGDAVQDETTLAWRTAEPAQVVVSDPRGQAVRMLTASGEASASATWDGRDERGLVVPDGAYTLSLLGDEGRLLGRAEAVVDTNRSALHYALLGPTTLRNLTCTVPGVPFDFDRWALAFAWMPAEDEVLYVVQRAEPGFPVGLLRVGLDGSSSYVAQDAWYGQAWVPSPTAVSPDGREILVAANGQLVAVDLASGARRTVGPVASRVEWSPDGRFILDGTAVLARDGSLVSDLGPGEWVWSPGSDRLASTDGSSLDIVSRDGTPVDAIPLGSDAEEEVDGVYPAGAVWRGDGKIVASLAFYVDDGHEGSWSDASFLVDPESRATRRLPFSAAEGRRQAAWSPDGARVLLADGELRLESGTSLGRLMPHSPDGISPRGTVALFSQYASDTGPGALVCPGKGADTLVFGGLANLVATMEVARLPGATGVVLRGTVGDLNLDHFQIDFADRADPATWHPIGVASDVPVADDQLAVWVPPQPGQYLLRLTVADRAGNSRVVTRLVPWERAPALTSFTQSERLISPNADGVKDEVRIRYTSLLPTHVDVRIVGPDPERPDGTMAPEVWRSAVEHPDPGPQAFVWGGRDSSGRLVPDGWYTVSVNGLPFRVEVDNTPPEIGLEVLGEPHATEAPITVAGPECEPNGPALQPPSRPLSTVGADLSLYVVDRNLAGWWTAPWVGGREPVFVPDTDASGAPLFEAGRPRVKRKDGRPVGLGVSAFVAGSYPPSTSLRLEARDLAGNVSVVAVEPPREAIVPLGAISRCEPLAAALTAGKVHELAPDNLYLQVGATLHHDSNVPARFELQPAEGGEWREVGQTIGGASLTTFRIDSFEALGLNPTATFTGRFRLQGAGGELVSPSFDFCPCQWRLDTQLLYDFAASRTALLVRGHLPSTMVSGQASLQYSPDGSFQAALPPLTLQPIEAGEVLRRFHLTLREGESALGALMPPLEMECSHLVVSVEVRDADGTRYPSKDVNPACQRVRYESRDSCNVEKSLLGLRQLFEFCDAKPGTLAVEAWGDVTVPVRVTLEGGPEAAPTAIGSFDFAPDEKTHRFNRGFTVPLGGGGEEAYPVRGTLTSLETGATLAKAEVLAVIDQESPTGEIVEPGEGRTACLASGVEGPELRTFTRFGDNQSGVSAPHPFARFPEGPWQTLLLTTCDGADCPSVLSTGSVHALNLGAGPLDNGWHDVRLDFCDASGNVGSTTRRVLVTRDPPKLQVRSVQPRVFSPNGDGQKEATLATVLLREPGVLTARVHAGDQTGAVVRTLFFDQPQATTEAGVFWDGRNDAGQRVPDGPYAIVFTAADACGGTGRASGSVEVDTVPPAVALTEPAGGQRVSASVEVRGQATDPHFGEWQLDVACGADPWSSLGSGRSALAGPGFLARWDTSRAPPGECRLRLAAEDGAGNRSPEAITAVLVERGDLLLRLAASPDVVSPNGDGRRETATLECELTRAARVWLQVRDTGGRVLHSFEDAAERAAGGWSFVWDGRDGAGQPVPDGDHVLWIRAEDPDVATVYEERATRLVLDRTPPSVVIARPAVGGYAPSTAWVRGSVSDAHLAEYRVTATPAGGVPVDLAHAFEGKADADLAPLGPLAEGPHTLLVVAADLAENETRLDVPFVVDSTPPRVAIQSPLNGAFLRRGDAPIPVTGLVGDDHLETWRLRFGNGGDPALLAEVATGSTGGNGMALGNWDVRPIPDGVYTLSLVATDRAGLSTEARVTVTLDGTPPVAAFSVPAAGSYVREPTAVVASAVDANLGSWALEAAPGDAASAYQWAPVADGKDPVDSGTLGQWSPLPLDGVYTLQLTARDKVDLAAKARVTVTVDTTPPPAPVGLRSQVARAREGYGNVRVTWSANTEADLAGYRISRDGVELTGDAFPDPTWDDADRIEGRYVYSVVAVDRAGNVSAKATLTVRVDLTPPIVSFASPAEGASVSGSVEVRGTAYSADDFAEYRLYVGAGAEPTTWTLLRTSSVPLASGRLGEWLPLADGPYVLALEADDTAGNRSRTTRPVVVDTIPPAPPVLVEVDLPGTPPDRLVPRWDPSPSTDVIGYLVYRNGRLANAVGIVLGDRKGYAVPGPTHEDDGLPDGKHCYRIVALDGAANESFPSNEICRSLDNRAPFAVVVQPPAGTRFGYPLRVVAHTADEDVVRIRFDWSPTGAGQWHELATRERAPEAPIPSWDATLDPEAQQLAPGDYDLRAVATDQSAKTDPAPAAVTVTFGDTTAPGPPEGLVALVDGADAALSWTASTAADLASYRLYRDGERIAEGVTDPRQADGGLAPGTYSYAVTAVDADGNESTPSAPAEAVVYALGLDEPAWPVTPAAVAGVAGGGSRPGTTVHVLRAGTPVAMAPANGGAFRVDGVSLVDDGNVLQARAEDAAGNRSIPSNEIVLIANAPPAAVADLTATVDGRSVSLAWSPVADTDLAGYVVRRDGQRLTDSVPQEEASGFEATTDWDSAALAFDGNPGTTWPAWDDSGEWTVHFASPILVERLHLRFAPSGGTPSPLRYRVLAQWQDRFVPIVTARDATGLAADHPLPAAFATTGLRVILESPARIAELGVDRLDALPAGAGAFDEQGVPEGRHAYAVSAIDRYGAEGPAGSVSADVGDVEPPGPPTGLVATPVGRDVFLTWSASPEPDVTGYVILRAGVRIGTSASSDYRDLALPNGTYTYAVIAVDEAGLESGASAPATAVIDVPAAPPAVPVILEPTDAANPVTMYGPRTDVAGRADAGSVVTLEVDGEPRGTAPAEPGFRLASSEWLPASPAALSPDGRLVAWVAPSEAIGVRGLDLDDRMFAVGGTLQPASLAFSPDGSHLVFIRWVYAGGYHLQLAVLDLGDGSVSVVHEGFVTAMAWSPDGGRLAVAQDEAYGTTLGVLDVASGAFTEVDRSAGVDDHLRWSPDGMRLAFVRSWEGAAADLRVLDLASGRSLVLDEQPWPDAAPSWSPDGRRLAWTTAERAPLAVRVCELDGARACVDVAEAGADVLDARFSPSGEWLSYVRAQAVEGGTEVAAVRVRQDRTGLVVTAVDDQAGWTRPDGHDWVGGQLALVSGALVERFEVEAGRFVVRDVALHPGVNHLVVRATDPVTYLTSPDSDTVTVEVSGDAFPDLAVEAEDVRADPALPAIARPAQVHVRVRNLGPVDAEGSDVALRIEDPDGRVVLDATAVLAAVPGGSSTWLAVPWTPASVGDHEVEVTLDPYGRVAEASEANNNARRTLRVLADEGLAARIATDRASYGAAAPVSVAVDLANPGRRFGGAARTTVEDADGREVVVLDERPVALDYGESGSWTLAWTTGRTWAGTYAVRIRVTATGEAEPRATAESAFVIEPDLAVRAQVAVQPATVAEGSAARFDLRVENGGTNAPLGGAIARLLVSPEGATGPPAFETVRALPLVLPAGTWQATDTWPSAQPAERYVVRFQVESAAGAVLASASALLAVEAGSPLVRGSLTLAPDEVLAGQSAEAQVNLSNAGTVSVSGYPLVVELVSGPAATVHAEVPASLDLAVGESRTLDLPLETGSLAAGRYVARLRGGAAPVTLDRADFVVHGLIAPPSPHAPPDGASVDTAHPILVVNDASSPEGAALTYEFQLFADAALTRPLPGAQGIPEAHSRTSWLVRGALAEDSTYWWRARATDGFSMSAWSAVFSFTVDAANRPPSAPVPDTPLPGARVASLQPLLTVRNGIDPERRPLTYEWNLARDAGMSDLVAAESGIPEGPGLTSWRAPVALEENAVYHWSVRASDRPAGQGGESPWSAPISFLVDTVDESPTAPQPIEPVGGRTVTSATPELVVRNAQDPEGSALVYRFEVDTSPSFDSAHLQSSDDLPEGPGETRWTPPNHLAENAVHYWRAFASDGTTATSSPVASFFVNVGNEPPSAPLALEPVDDQAVGTPTPTLRVRNAVDPESDALTYDFEVRDAAGDLVASVAGVPSSPLETGWTVTPALAEDRSFTWTARASDGRLAGPWSAPAGFRVDAVAQPPSAPIPRLPADGATVEERRPALVVENASSPGGLPLTYTFEIEAVAADGSTTPIDRAEGIPEGPVTTAWAPSADLLDGAYAWRVRASDSRQHGPWSPTSYFDVLVDPPPAPPTGLLALPGDARVHLDWNASPEPDVAGYRVYRATTSGGPYGLVAGVTAPAHEDLGLTNGVRYFYVVRALDARAESGPSNEATAQPEASPVLVAEVAFEPSTVGGECLIEAGNTRRFANGLPRGNCEPSPGCPAWLLATIELPAGNDPASIEVASLRLLGSVPADPSFHELVDTDHDGLLALRVRFPFDAVAPLLSVGDNVATVVGRSGASEVRGVGRIEVAPLAMTLRVTPRTLQRRSHGQDVQARMTFAEGVAAAEVSVASVRLNGSVPVERVVQIHGRELVVKFDRAAVIGVLPVGGSVEVRVTGTLRGIPFVGVDHIRVIE
jgi:subtilase family serine protease/Tol biopolymer transport system component